MEVDWGGNLKLNYTTDHGDVFHAVTVISHLEINQGE